MGMDTNGINGYVGMNGNGKYGYVGVVAMTSIVMRTRLLGCEPGSMSLRASKPRIFKKKFSLDLRPWYLDLDHAK